LKPPMGSWFRRRVKSEQTKEDGLHILHAGKKVRVQIGFLCLVAQAKETMWGGRDGWAMSSLVLGDEVVEHSYLAKKKRQGR